jgi:hypothetical protein
MANLRHNGRWVLDTAESVVAAGTFVRILSAFYIGTTDVHDCILHDGNGKEIIKFKLGTVATTGYQAGHVFGGEGVVVDGLDLDTIDSGKLYVYLGKL